MIYGISDLHLDHSTAKTMEVFGPGWEDYENRIFNNWQTYVRDEDLVLVPGDISWAMTEKEVIFDLDRLDKLPGKKIFIKGNHDYWWQSLSKLKSLEYHTIHFMQNDSYVYGDYVVVGTRGWIPIDDQDFSESDLKVYKRELIRLNLSLESIDKNDLEKDKIVIMHYPPFNRDGSLSEFNKLIADSGAKHCLYGHLHGDGHKAIIEGELNGVNYSCISADYLKFVPLKIGG